jgi:hypothetical protein
MTKIRAREKNAGVWLKRVRKNVDKGDTEMIVEGMQPHQARQLRDDLVDIYGTGEGE